jgi:glycosyltransferase involved in cell wall biosynthesis
MTPHPSTTLVTVVLPVFNDERYVRESLDSVVRQTHPELELIVVDDGSVDATPAVIDQFLGSSTVRERFRDRIVFEVLPRNQGAHEALNVGIQRAGGTLVSLLNSDDRYPDDRIEVLAAALSDSPAMLAFGAVRMIDTGGRDVTQDDWLGCRFHNAQRSIAWHPSVGFALLNSNVAISTGNFLFRRSLFDQVGPFQALRYCHDWDFLLQSVLVAEPLYVPRVAYEYRLHAANGFRSLQHVAREDSEHVFRRYFSRIVREQYENPIAPGPRTWPGVFEVWLQGMGLMPCWSMALRSPE